MTPEQLQSNRKRFEDKCIPEPNSGCLLWIGSVTGGAGTRRAARPLFNVTGRGNITGSRAAYMLYRGAIPNGLCVLHKCDTPLCVNIDHLFLGTQAENMADKVSKGRSARGVLHPKNKLSEDDVRDIRAATSSHAAAGRQYSVSESTIQHIRTRRIWRHIP